MGDNVAADEVCLREFIADHVNSIKNTVYARISQEFGGEEENGESKSVRCTSN